MPYFDSGRLEEFDNCGCKCFRSQLRVLPPRTFPQELRVTEPEPIVLDVSGLNCPMPLLKAKQALNAMQPGTHLRVIATDPGSVRDFAVFAEQSGNRLLESAEEAGRFLFVLQKKT
jgi:tRNA 2-thiouridine synthesizing protein A